MVPRVDTLGDMVGTMVDTLGDMVEDMVDMVGVSVILVDTILVSGT